MPSDENDHDDDFFRFFFFLLLLGDFLIALFLMSGLKLFDVADASVIFIISEMSGVAITTAGVALVIEAVSAPKLDDFSMYRCCHDRRLPYFFEAGRLRSYSLTVKYWILVTTMLVMRRANRASAIYVLFVKSLSKKDLKKNGDGQGDGASTRDFGLIRSWDFDSSDDDIDSEEGTVDDILQERRFLDGSLLPHHHQLKVGGSRKFIWRRFREIQENANQSIGILFFSGHFDPNDERPRQTLVIQGVGRYDRLVSRCRSRVDV